MADAGFRSSPSRGPLRRLQPWASAPACSLHFAADKGDLARISEILAKGYDVNAFDVSHRTPLHDAVEHENFEAVELLLRSGADLNAHDERFIGETPLAGSAATCSLRMARTLIDAGADPTIPGWMQLTALDRAEDRRDGDGPLVHELMLKASKEPRRATGPPTRPQGRASRPGDTSASCGHRFRETDSPVRFEAGKRLVRSGERISVFSLAPTTWHEATPIGVASVFAIDGRGA
jgi:Ankyrin repeats (3 copies)